MTSTTGTSIAGQHQQQSAVVASLHIKVQRLLKLLQEAIGRAGSGMSTVHGKTQHIHVLTYSNVCHTACYTYDIIAVIVLVLKYGTVNSIKLRVLNQPVSSLC
jgi:hypothetical protein